MNAKRYIKPVVTIVSCALLGVIAVVLAVGNNHRTAQIIRDTDIEGTLTYASTDADNTTTCCTTEIINSTDMYIVSDNDYAGYIETTTSSTQVTEANSTTNPVVKKATTVESVTEPVISTITQKVVEIFSTKENSDKMTDLDYMASVIFQEAGSDACSDETRRYVGEVVLNRVDHRYYPNTIYEVLIQKGQYGIYSRTGVPKLDRGQDGVDRSYRIANKVLTSERTVPRNVIYQAEFPQGSGIWKYIDGIYFCYE